MEENDEERLEAEEPQEQPQEQPAEAGLTEADRARIDEQIRQIHELDPAIGGPGDLLALDRKEQFYAYVTKNNLSFADAYRLTYADRLTEARAAAEKQRALNLASSKNHLTPLSQRGNGSLAVPDDEMALFRELNPGVADSEIQKYYNEYRKQ